MTVVRRTHKGGFTLVEILIVVIILGILAAIVIPQFTSASTEARESNLRSQLQTLRSQIALYKLQHQDTLPDLVSSWDPLLKKTDVSGSTSPATGAQTFGPYMQDTPTNSLNGKTTVTDGTGNVSAATGFVYDYAAGAGSGKLWGTDIDGKTVLQ